jgi:prenyltransferase/squalene oxidase-like repeat protein
MHGAIRRGIVAFILILCFVLPLRAEVTAAAVDESIRAGVKFLLDRQDKASGSWTEYPGEPGGLTALVTLALLNCGESKDDPRIAKALDYLERMPDPQQTYSTSLQIMAFCQADPAKYKLKIARLARWLEGHQIRAAGNDGKGGWSYSASRDRADNSNTQFAMLALHEAERAGVKVDDQTWQLALNYWTQPRMQHPNGGYGYEPGHPPSGSMTCAAISSLIIAYDRLSMGEAKVENGRIQCCGNQEEHAPLDNALRWMARHFSVDRNPTAGIGPLETGGSKNWLLYYLYGMERVGRMSGRRFIGDHDWYREGCEKLLKHQKDTLNNSWVGDGIIEDNPLIATSSQSGRPEPDDADRAAVAKGSVVAND